MNNQSGITKLHDIKVQLVLLNSVLDQHQEELRGLSSIFHSNRVTYLQEAVQILEKETRLKKIEMGMIIEDLEKRDVD